MVRFKGNSQIHGDIANSDFGFHGADTAVVEKMTSPMFPFKAVHAIVGTLQLAEANRLKQNARLAGS